MRSRSWIALIGATMLATGTGVAMAQDTVIIRPEQRTVIREYVQREPVASIDLPGIELNIGTPVPETVELYPIDVPDVTYQYVVVDGRTVIVDPADRRIVEIIR
ncbi:hypothetical protein MesoLjLc_16810 [Mesorhizobium sp. L-8-10]|uniref:DUF1236 domain-containing protein n=1 Tax=unclassified Mesorhizobium TaxID=325217 RepID=UPI001935CD0B|nr:MULTISPECIES: DUF1236 domain-containing protein [unclassified Mesorhizobium]BCH22058.1 hypothetical protein MesoLjLb_18430 [Mesorhizobium sp. L-8-3]BCH29751.1 hypothetical protein MesoLjLc_16810 [Mesorhizobium sp. L-8-10]